METSEQSKYYTILYDGKWVVFRNVDTFGSYFDGGYGITGMKSDTYGEYDTEKEATEIMNSLNHCDECGYPVNMCDCEEEQERIANSRLTLQ